MPMLSTIVAPPMPISRNPLSISSRYSSWFSTNIISIAMGINLTFAQVGKLEFGGFFAWLAWLSAMPFHSISFFGPPSWQGVHSCRAAVSPWQVRHVSKPSFCTYRPISDRKPEGWGTGIPPWQVPQASLPQDSFP